METLYQKIRRHLNAKNITIFLGIPTLFIIVLFSFGVPEEVGSCGGEESVDSEYSENGGDESSEKFAKSSGYSNRQSKGETKMGNIIGSQSDTLSDYYLLAWEQLERWTNTGKQELVLTPSQGDQPWKRTVKEVWNDQLEIFAFLPALTVLDVGLCREKMDFGQKTIDIIQAIKNHNFGDTVRLYSEFLNKSFCLYEMDGLESFYSVLVDRVFDELAELPDQKILFQGIFNLGLFVFDVTKHNGFSPWLFTLRDNIDEVKNLLRDFPMQGLGLWLYNIENSTLNQFKFAIDEMREFLRTFEDARRLGNGTCQLLEMADTNFTCLNGLKCGGDSSLTNMFGRNSMPGQSFQGSSIGETFDFLLGMTSGSSACDGSGGGSSSGNKRDRSNQSGGGASPNSPASCLSKLIRQQGSFADQAHECSRKNGTLPPSGGPRIGSGVTTFGDWWSKQCSKNDAGNAGNDPDKETKASTDDDKAKKAQQQAKDNLNQAAKALEQEAKNQTDKKVADNMRKGAQKLKNAANSANNITVNVVSDSEATNMCSGASACAVMTSAATEIYISDKLLSTGQGKIKGKDGKIKAANIDPMKALRHEFAHGMLNNAGITAERTHPGQIDQHDMMAVVNGLLNSEVFYDPEGSGGCYETAMANRMFATYECIKNMGNNQKQNDLTTNAKEKFRNQFINPGEGNFQQGPRSPMMNCMLQGGPSVRRSLSDRNCAVKDCAPDSDSCTCDLSRVHGRGSYDTNYNNSLFGAKDPLPFRKRDSQDIKRKANEQTDQKTTPSKSPKP